MICYIKGIKGMVCHIFKILNGNEITNLNIKEYNNMKLDYADLCWRVKMSWDRTKEVSRIDDNLDEIIEIVDNDKFIQMSDKMEKFKDKYFDHNNMLKHEYCYYNLLEDTECVFEKHFSKQDLLDYLGIIPFTPSVMINISPDWKCVKDKMTDTRKINILTGIVENYLAEGQRYDYYSYVIENGSNGDHIHAHIVAHINPKLGKSVNTHLAKGNHTQQLKKLANKLKGMGGIIKGPSVQKIFLRNEELVNDKLDYLIEERKPEGHKNKSVLTGRVDKILFTVK